MSNLNPAPSGASQPTLNQAGINRVRQVLVTTVLIGALLFVSAGRLDWLSAWVLLALVILTLITAGIYLVRKSPDVMNERGKGVAGGKTWDRVLAPVCSVFVFVIYVVAGFDAGRFQWSVMSWPCRSWVALAICWETCGCTGRCSRLSFASSGHSSVAIPL